MNRRINDYLNVLFENKQLDSRYALLKEELGVNLSEEYEDLLRTGSDPDSAFYKVISGIGDINELLGKTKSSKPAYNTEKEKTEEHMDKQADSGNDSARKIQASIYWTAVTIFYLVVSFVSGNWHVTWIIFLLATALFSSWELNHMRKARKSVETVDLRQQNPDTILESGYQTAYETDSFSLKKEKALRSSILWTLLVAVYVVISFQTGAWAFSWIIFLFGVLAQKIIEYRHKVKRDKAVL